MHKVSTKEDRASQGLKNLANVVKQKWQQWNVWEGSCFRAPQNFPSDISALPSVEYDFCPCVSFSAGLKTSHQVESRSVGDGAEVFHWGDQVWWARRALLHALGSLLADGVVEPCPLVGSWNYLFYIIHSHGKSEMWELLYSHGGKHVIRNIRNLYIYIFSFL